MDLGTVFKISLYGLTALIGVILGLAEGEGSQNYGLSSGLQLPFLSVPIVICGYLLTERKTDRRISSGMGLSSTWANILGMMALIATGYEFSGESREGKLLAGTHLLLYVTWIVLFQQKTIRLYWFLLALGILQLAVASVLTSKGWFGFCAVGYMFCAVWTLSIFSLWRAEQMFEEDNLRRAESALGRSSAHPESQSSRRPESEVQSAVQHEEGNAVADSEIRHRRATDNLLSAAGEFSVLRIHPPRLGRPGFFVARRCECLGRPDTENRSGHFNQAGRYGTNSRKHRSGVRDSTHQP